MLILLFACTGPPNIDTEPSCVDDDCDVSVCVDVQPGDGGPNFWRSCPGHAGECACLNDDGTDAGTEVPTFTLTFGGTGYTSHNTQTVRAVLENAGGDPVGDVRSETVTGGHFEFVFSSLRAGDYALHWYADVNGDGSCQTPPADHAWSHTFTLSATDAIYEHVHATDFNPDACGQF